MANQYYDNSDGAQRFQPGTNARADEVDGKLDQVAAGFDGAEQDINRSIKLPVSGASQELNATPLQRRRRVVGFDADGNLTLLTGFNWRDDWTIATEYFVNDVFRDPATKNIYVTITRHTSAAALSTDITAGRVELAINVEDVEAAKAAAQTAAGTATTKAGEASASASQSATARDKAQQWAEENEDTAVETGQFSARHYAIKSAASASASSSSAGQSAAARDKSQAWAETAENTEVQAGQYSAKHHALKSATSASASSTASGQSATARDASQAARDKAQQWAEAESEVETGQYSAKYWAEQAAQAVSDGVIDDAATNTAFTWSSQKISDELQQTQETVEEELGQAVIAVSRSAVIGAPDWPVTLTYDDNGTLTQAVYSQGNARFRETLNRSDGRVSGVLYEQSADNGATWEVIGTETLVRDDAGKLTATTWVGGV